MGERNRARTAPAASDPVLHPGWELRGLAVLRKLVALDPTDLGAVTELASAARSLNRQDLRPTKPRSRGVFFA